MSSDTKNILISLITVVVVVGLIFLVVRFIPSGVIVMWGGEVAKIPSGWVLCDGGNGTPNLCDRFIVGAGSSYNVGVTGGESEVILSIDQMPSHTHIHNHLPAYFADAPGGAMAQGTSTRDVPPKWETDPTGGGKPHENRPPYYALCYIMKV
jgi:microcystin-dependent protein